MERWRGVEAGGRFAGGDSSRSDLVVENAGDQGARVLCKSISTRRKRSGNFAGRPDDGDCGVLGSGKSVCDLDLPAGRSECCGAGRHGGSIAPILVRGWQVDWLFCAGKIEEGGAGRKIRASDLRRAERARRHVEQRRRYLVYAGRVHGDLSSGGGGRHRREGDGSGPRASRIEPTLAGVPAGREALHLFSGEFFRTPREQWNISGLTGYPGEEISGCGQLECGIRRARLSTVPSRWGSGGTGVRSTKPRSEG